MSQKAVANPSAFERANYLKALDSWRPDPAAVLPKSRSASASFRTSGAERVDDYF